jgi:hypothetical protein
MMHSVPEDEIDRLYGLPLEEFVAERAALAKRLRKDGRREEAADAAKLRKPSVAAWAANQVLRSQAADARKLFAAGDDLAAAQQALLDGKGKRDRLDKAAAGHRDALGKLADAAAGLVDANGRSLAPATLAHVQETLNAVSLDPGLREEGKAARLVKEQSYAGMGLTGDLGGPPAIRPAKAKAKKPQAPAKQRPEPEKRPDAKARKAAEAERRKHERRIAQAQQKVDAAEKAVAKARKQLERATADEDAARERLRELG